MTADRWLPAGLPPRDTAPLLLFCLPYAGGGASIYRTWAAAAPPGLTVCPVQLPGREQRLRDAPFRDLTSLVSALDEALRPHLDRPFAVFGHSMGALIAYEWARRLATGPSSALLQHLFVSGRPAPARGSTRPPVHALPEPEFLAELRRLRGTPDAVLAHQELLQLLLPTLRADFQVVETYRWAPGPRLTVPVTAFGGTHDDVSADDLQAWREVTESGFECQLLAGDHFFLHDARERLLAAMAHACKCKMPAHL